jgi:hypothetical protein
MNCEFTRDRLDAYAAGSLAPAEREAVSAHIEGCAECTADLEATLFVAPHTAALPREVPADPGLWAGIESRLTPRGRFRLRTGPLLAMAAALLLAVGAGWWLRGLTTDAGRESRVTRVETLPYEAEVASLRNAMNDLEQALIAEGRLPAPLSESFKRDLRTLEAAITEASVALTADPTNEDIRELYRAAFRRKLEALRRAAAVYVES